MPSLNIFTAILIAKADLPLPDLAPIVTSSPLANPLVHSSTIGIPVKVLSIGLPPSTSLNISLIISPKVPLASSASVTSVERSNLSNEVFISSPLSTSSMSL